MSLRGSDAAERRGIVWALSDLDHPMGVMSTHLNRASRGTVVIVGLKLNKV
jgi:hypothetical protein